MLPSWLRSWFTQTAPPMPAMMRIRARPLRALPERIYYAYCQACLSVLEVDQDGRLLPADARETARWRQVVHDQVTELESQTAALMERGR